MKLFTNESDQYNYLVKELKRITKGSAIVAARKKSDAKRLRRRLTKDGIVPGDRVIVETIRRALPYEADNVLVFSGDLPIPGSKDATVRMAELYAIGSRAKKRLEVLTSQSAAVIEESAVYDAIRDTATIDASSQRHIVKPFAKFPSVRDNANFTKKKLQSSTIDSLVLAVNEDLVPFVPDFPVGKSPVPGKLASKCERGFSYAWGSLDVTVIRRGRYHKFEFFDLSPLHKSGFRDDHIVKYALDFLFWYFDHRIPLSSIHVSRCDLHHFVFNTSGDDRGGFSGFAKEVNAVTAKSIYQCHTSSDGEKCESVKLHSLREGVVGGSRNQSVYANFGTRKDELTFCWYSPNGKQNDNRIHIDGYKVELRLKGKRLAAKYAFSELRRADKLMEALQEDPSALQEVLARVHERQLGVSLEAYTSSSLDTPDSVVPAIRKHGAPGTSRTLRKNSALFPDMLISPCVLRNNGFNKSGSFEF